ncbi:uncharacterized protein IAS62_005450 [Cryptococcus decagattii]|uniref:Uncharacterized protein n=1 Tax=Cryptococcus decagattii TaxID=1859122 RepID=A0ABZ2AZW5_9TREE
MFPASVTLLRRYHTSRLLIPLCKPSATTDTTLPSFLTASAKKSRDAGLQGDACRSVATQAVTPKSPELIRARRFSSNLFFVSLVFLTSCTHSTLSTPSALIKHILRRITILSYLPASISIEA